MKFIVDCKKESPTSIGWGVCLDFENKTDFEKTKELVEKLKPAKKNRFGKDLKITGRIKDFKKK